MTGSGDRRPASGATTTSAPAATSGGTLGTVLLVIGAVIGVLILLWLISNVFSGQLGSGGLILGLLLLAIFAGPFLGGGWYLRSRSASERAEAETFTARRGVLDNDRVVRRELARELGQRADALSRAAPALSGEDAATARQVSGELRDVMQDVQAPGYDSTTWLEETAARLDAGQLEQLRRYDDLVLEEVRRLEGLGQGLGREPQGAARLKENAALLAQHVREREALLGRARRASGLTAQEILSAGVQPRRRLSTPLELGLEDAVTYNLDDYVVRGVISYFAGARQWRSYQLHDGKQERWLEVRGEGADIAWYELRAAGPDGTVAGLASAGEGGPATLDGVAYAPAEAGSASVGVESAAGRRDGVFVEYQRYRGAENRRLVVERWPDGTRVLIGQGISRDDLDLWTKPAVGE
jgi:hypothetical protein